MKKIWKKSLITIAVLSNMLYAESGDFYAGVERYGISGKYDFIDKVTAQAIVGAWGFNNLTSITGRGLYKFKEQDFYDLYGYGSLTSWTWDNGFDSETVFGFGGGVGIEYNIQGLDRDLPPIFISADGGLQVANFSRYGGFGGLGIGFGVHYKF